MKKILLLGLLSVSLLSAKPTFKDVLAMPIVGAVLLPVLVVGDYRWQYLTNTKQCTVDTYIYPGVPCTKWFKKNQKLK